MVVLKELGFITTACYKHSLLGASNHRSFGKRNTKSNFEPFFDPIAVPIQFLANGVSRDVIQRTGVGKGAPSSTLGS